MTPDEEWRVVPGSGEAYEVSDLGRVRSLDRQVYCGNGATRFAPGVDLRWNLDSVYPRVGVVVDGAMRLRHIHRIVMDAFVGQLPEGYEVRHLDGDPLNNALSNLSYGTPSQNKRDVVAHGRHFFANKTHCPRGHPYDESNTRVYDGRRFCRTCPGERYHERMAARREDRRS